MKNVKYFIVLFVFSITSLYSQRFTLSGYVLDQNTGEALIGVNVYLNSDISIGTTTNEYGYYALSLDQGSYEVQFSYTGFEPYILPIDLDEDIQKEIQLQSGFTLGDVVVKDKSNGQDVESTEMGTVKLDVAEVKKLPVLFGEVDVLKTLQLLPGVVASSEGNAGLFVRGGAADQNLVLLDEATVYNAGHLFGFFSVFNADALKSTKLIKGSLPAKYGGRLSSVVDIQMRDGSKKDYIVQGGVGLISSRLTAEGPIIKDKASFMLSGRRTYLLDLAQPFINNTNFAGTNYYFYDLNAKLNFELSDKDKLFVSAYLGNDVFRFNSANQDFNFEVPYGNEIVSLRWNRILKPKLFMNVSAIYNNYEFEFTGGQDQFNFGLQSRVEDLQLKTDFNYSMNENHYISFGASIIRHQLSPSNISGTDGEVNFSNNLFTKYGLEYAFYFQDEMKLGNRLKLNAGVRLSAFTHLGPYESSLTDQQYDRGKSIITYANPEPRLSATYLLPKNSSLKASIAYTAQYIHLVSNTTSTLPTDIWVPSTELVRPQTGLQYALGYFKDIENGMYTLSAEVYYRNMYNQIDYREDFVNEANRDVELDFVFGKGRAYGLEVLARKNEGKFTGWLAYTLSRTERSIDAIQEGAWYPAFYDKTHDLSCVLNYKFSPKWELSTVFVYGTGQAYTPVSGVYRFEDKLNVLYGSRNSARLKDYHRLDFSVTYTPKPNSNRRFKSAWNFSVYNVYSRLNPTFVYTDFQTNPNSGEVTAEGVNVALFPIIPSVTWNFKWNTTQK